MRGSLVVLMTILLVAVPLQDNVRPRPPSARKASGPRPRIYEHMIVLGVDPGIANTGYGIVSSIGSKLQALEYGVIETRSTSAPETRLSGISRAGGGVVARVF